MMTPAERKKLKQQRKLLNSYRIRLNKLIDIVPNNKMELLLSDNNKLIQFFLSGEATKFEESANSKPTKPIRKVELTPEQIKKGLTVELYKDLKAQGVNDKEIMEMFGLYAVKLNNWKKENGLAGSYQKSDKKPRKKSVSKTKKGVKELVATKVEPVNVDSSKDKVKEFKELLMEKQSDLDASNALIKNLEAELEQLKAKNIKYFSQLELAQQSERKAINELIEFQTEYRKLEVDYRNQSNKINKLKEDIEYLKPYQHLSLIVMERYIIDNKRFDAFVEANQ